MPAQHDRALPRRRVTLRRSSGTPSSSVTEGTMPSIAAAGTPAVGNHGWEDPMNSLHQGFQETDESEATFRWLDRVDANPLAQDLKARMLEVCPVRAGDQVLDVGCGLGHEALRLAERVGPRGMAVGIDINSTMIAEATRRAADSPLHPRFEVGDAQQLRFAADSFDMCRTERVLRYLARPDEALREMLRVTRPGAYVIAFDWDSDATVVDAPDAALSRRVAEVLDAAVPHPWMGRQLFGLFLRAGLADVRVIAYPVSVSGATGFGLYQQLNSGTIARAVETGRLTPADAAAWWRGLEQRDPPGAFFWANLGFIVAGRKVSDG